MINSWLGQFSVADRDIAARILDSTDFISNIQIREAFRDALISLTGGGIPNDANGEKWRFAPFSSSVGESGDSMCHQFRIANGLTSNTYRNKFIHLSQIAKQRLGSSDHVVFIDDISASGTQVETLWDESLAELIAGGPQTHLVLVSATEKAIEIIENKTDLQIIVKNRLNDEDNIFNSNCKYFDKTEREKLLKYCKRANKRNPLGFGDLGLITVFPHRCPNNSIPILHMYHSNWQGIFRRD